MFRKHLQIPRCKVPMYKIQLMMKQKHHPLVWIIDLLCTLPSVQTRRLLLRMIHQLVSERDSSAKNKTISQYGAADNSDYLLFDTRRIVNLGASSIETSYNRTNVNITTRAPPHVPNMITIHTVRHCSFCKKRNSHDEF